MKPDVAAVIRLVAAERGVPIAAMRRPGCKRGGAAIVGARHLAMYLCSSELGLKRLVVAQAFSRDRTTVSKAVRRIEELRDDPSIDAAIAALELRLRSQPILGEGATAA